MNDVRIINSKPMLLASGFILAVLLAAIPVLPTYAATITWNGDGDGTTFADGDNWVGDVAPTDGDDLVFPADPDMYPDPIVLTNDLVAGTSFNSIQVTEGTSSYLGTIEITGNEIDLAGDITIDDDDYTDLRLNLDVTFSATVDIQGNLATVSFGAYGGTTSLDLGANNLTIGGTTNTFVHIYSVLTGSGDITQDNGGLILYAANASYAGAITADNLIANFVSALGSTAGATTVNGNLRFNLPAGNLEITEDLNVGGAITFNTSATSPGLGATGYGPNVTFTGDVTLSDDVELLIDPYTWLGKTVSFENVDLAGFEITSGWGPAATVIVNDRELDTEVVVQTLTDETSDYVFAAPGYRYIVNGVRANTFIYNTGRLMGTGEVGELTVYEGGILAPGESPGCLASGNLIFYAGGIYEFEIEGDTVCTEYDQMQVTGTVDVTDAILDVQRLSSYTPAAGTQFIIIDNDGTDAVTGEFEGMPAGSTFTIEGVTYRISYTGGSGNDVVLTVIDTTVEEPDTGLAKLIDPTIVALISTAIATSLMMGSAYIARRR